MMHHRIVSRDEWLAARKAHLAKEKELTRLRDQLSAERRELPWVKIEKALRLRCPFETNQPVSVDYMNGIKEPARAAAE